MRKSVEQIEYKNSLDQLETQRAIKFVKDEFQVMLAKKLHLLRVSAPLFVKTSSGLNDGLNGVERPISFNIKDEEENIEIIHSLAKWKRMALAKYNIPLGEGIYTDMNAIRKDEDVDFLHSIYVDQWDWEKVIKQNQRRFSYLRKTVKDIYSCLLKLSEKVSKKYPEIKHDLPKDIYFISTSELEEKYPTLSRKEREDAICKEHKAVFLYQIGWNLKDGLPHDGRASDYDDWKLNGDILLYYPLYEIAFEISSMGIRVDKKSLLKQLKARGEMEKVDNDYCKAIINDELPLSIGGGIGQSRLAMYMLNKAHIGEVQASIWNQKEVSKLKKKGIELL